MAKRAKKSSDPVLSNESGADPSRQAEAEAEAEEIFADFEAAAVRLIEYIGRYLAEAESDWDDFDSVPTIDDEEGLKESNKRIVEVIRGLEAVKKLQNQRLRDIKEIKDSARSGR